MDGNREKSETVRIRRVTTVRQAATTAEARMTRGQATIRDRSPVAAAIGNTTND